MLFGLKMSKRDLASFSSEESASSTLGAEARSSSGPLEIDDAGMSLLLKDLESLAIRAATANNESITGVPDALLCAMQRGLMASTLTSLTLSCSKKHHNLDWDDLRPCLLACKNLQSLTIEKVKLISTHIPDEPRQQTAECMPDLKRLKLVDIRKTDSILTEPVHIVASNVRSFILDELAYLKGDSDHLVSSYTNPEMTASFRELWSRLQKIHFETWKYQKLDLKTLNWFYSLGLQLKGITWQEDECVTVLRTISRRRQLLRSSSNANDAPASGSSLLLAATERPLSELAGLSIRSDQIDGH